MQVILSQPYVGPLYWWFDQERSLSLSKTPSHEYYANLFGDVAANLDAALACALIYETFIIPPADAVHPGMGDLDHMAPSDLGLTVAPWDAMEDGRRVADQLGDGWRTDPVLSELLEGKSEWAAEMELQYAVTDALLAFEYDVPVLCSDGRRAVVRRLIDLGLIAVDQPTADQFEEPSSTSSMVDSYTSVAGLTFGVDGVRDFMELKGVADLRKYADTFRRVLESPETTKLGDLYPAIAQAMERQAVATKVKGAFETAGKILDVGSLAPGVGSVPGALAIGADLAAAGAGRRAKKARWYELSWATASYRSRRDLERELGRRGLR